LLGDKLTCEILADWHTASISEKLRAALGFVVKLTNTPDGIDYSDIASLRQAGVTDGAIIDATYICVGFNIINRIADAMDFDMPEPAIFVSGAWFMRKFGYRLMSGSWSRKEASPDGQSPADLYDSMMKRLCHAVFAGPGTLDAVVRQKIGLGAPLDGTLGQYANKVAQRDYRGIDKCIADLHSEAYSDDQIFEATVSAALGAGIMRLQLALEALSGSVASQAA